MKGGNDESANTWRVDASGVEVDPPPTCLCLRRGARAVDDVPPIRRMLVRMFKAALGEGCHVVEAYSSKEATDAIRESLQAPGVTFDVVVLDMISSVL
jgi:hypothetical protein